MVAARDPHYIGCAARWPEPEPRILMRLQRVLALPAVLLLVAGAASAQQPVSLFEGRNLADWSDGAAPLTRGADGTVTVGGKSGLVYYRPSLRDFVLDIEYRGETPDAESGIFLRLPAAFRPADPAVASRIGYEVQIRDVSNLPAPPNAQAGAAPRPNWEMASGALVGVAAAWRPVA